MSESQSIDEVFLYPACTNWLCADYFTPLQIFLLFLLTGRFILTIIILLLGLKMEKDFMRSITMAIFIPISLTEIFNIYSEIVAYISLFAESEEQYDHIFNTFLGWTHSLLYVIYDYVHYNILIMLILLLYCCRLAYQAEERIKAFPLKKYNQIRIEAIECSSTICVVAQIIPFFLCVVYYISDGTTDVALRVLSISSRVVMIVGFVIISAQILTSFFLLSTELPYTHANSTDMQLRDARSRLAWTLVYLILPYIAFIPFLVNDFAWLIAFNGNADPTMKVVMSICEMIQFIIQFHRPLFMSIITVAFLPPYRRAMLLTVLCCGCCPKLQIDPLPRKPNDMSLMYRYADF
ncbi:unnamed protein product [Haemonchus placei]|uniref:G_PROTEIN_RECEP_F1_2 domain-containing protein n=1 Tax=Haemonchus placei TaxID=6290 RepID=A0A0N4VU75_HAEPC|nr:unnamed protein product [Haemonchus placei]